MAHRFVPQQGIPKRTVFGSLLLMCLLHPLVLSAQDIEEVSFKIYINRTELGFIEAAIADTTVWLCLPGFTDALELEFTLQPDSLYFSTCLPDPKHCFVIHNDTLIRNGEKRSIGNLIRYTNGQPYIQPRLLQELSGLELSVTIRSLAVTITNGSNVPTILRREQELYREMEFNKRLQISTLRIDTLPSHNFHWSSLGYSLSPTFSINGRVSATLGANVTGMLLKGAFYVNYNYSSLSSIDRNIVMFRWDNRNINKAGIKQISVFRSYNNLVMQTRGYANGVYISNDLWNAVYQRSYSFRGTTTPLTPVEIYANGQLLDYITSDSSGHYRMEVPINAGDNKFSAIAYDDYALPMRQESTLFLPPDLQPRRKISYKAAAGYIDDGSTYLNGEGAYGITDFLTLRLGTENIFKHDKLRSIFILSGNYAYQKALRINAEYIPAVRWNTFISANYRERIGSSFFYEQYAKGQNKIPFAPLQHMQFMLNSEIPLWRINGFMTVNAEHYKYDYATSFNTDWRWNLYLRRVTLTFSLSTCSQNTIKLSDPAYGIQLGYNFRGKLYNELGYDYFTRFGQSRIRNRITYQPGNHLRCFFNTDYEFTFRQFNIAFGITWRLPSVELNSTNSITRGYASTSTQVSGSVLFYGKGVHAFSNRYVAGTSLHVAFFLDVNGNHTYDRNEEILPNGKVIVHGGGEAMRNRYGIFYMNVPADNMFRFVVPNQQFDDISWQVVPFEKVLLLSGYQEESIYIPVHIVSEIMGQVTCGDTPVPDLPIHIINLTTGKQITVSTDEWGFYNHAGLTCGTYHISISDEVLQQRRLQAPISTLTLEIPEGREGTLIEGKDFTVIKQ